MKTEITPFLQELANEKTVNVNGKPMHTAIYNLIVSRRDLKLWSRGMKPHRMWFVTDVKRYFGLKGNDRQKLVNQIENLVETYAK